MTQKVANRLFMFDYDAGTTTWRRSGKRAGCIDRRGNNTYVRIDCGAYGKHYEHRLHFLAKHGRWPTPLVHHEDGDGTNNKASNIDEASYQRNRWETMPGPNHSTGHTCIYKAGKRFVTDMTTTTPAGKVRYRRSFLSLDEAVAAKGWAIAEYRSVW